MKKPILYLKYLQIIFKFYYVSDNRIRRVEKKWIKSIQIVNVIASNFLFDILIITDYFYSFQQFKSKSI